MRRDVRRAKRSRRLWMREVPGVVCVLFVSLLGMSETRESGTQVTLAYLDPGAGSLMIQALIAGIAGAAVAIRIFWTRIKRFLGFRSGQPVDKETERNSPSDE